MIFSSLGKRSIINARDINAWGSKQSTIILTTHPSLWNRIIIYFYLSENSAHKFPYFNFCYNIQDQQEIGQSNNNLLKWLDLWSAFRESQIPTAPYLFLKYKNKNTNMLYMHLRCSAIIWETTKNHCDRSWSDCTMTISSLSHVSNIFPASVFVFGDCWYYARWSKAADD